MSEREARRLVDMTGHIGGATAVPGGAEFTVRFPGGAELDVPVPAGFTRDEFIAAVAGFAKVRLVIELTEDESSRPEARFRTARRESAGVEGTHEGS